MTEAVILAAGLGTRLGRPHPKPLTPLVTGQTIIRRQVDLLREHFGPDLRITVVVGFKLEQIVEAVPDVSFVYNPYFDTTNTNRSLLRALELTGHDGVLWLNGDVVFVPEVLDLLDGPLAEGGSFLAVNTADVADEEVKYTLEGGLVAQLSKQVPLAEARGEAVGINYVDPADKPVLIRWLRECADDDYFERGIELAIERDGRRFSVVDVSALHCLEIDAQEDLDDANAAFSASADRA